MGFQRVINIRNFSMVGLVVAISIFTYLLNNIKNEVYTTEAKNLLVNLDDKLKEKKSVGIASVVALANNCMLGDAVSANDKGMLKQELSRLSKKYRDNTEFKNIKVHIHTKDNVSFFRSWKNKSGDDLSWRNSLHTVNGTRQKVVGFEVGRAGASLRAIVPLYNSEQKHIGSIEFMQGLNSVAKKFDKQGGGFLFLMDKSQASTAKFANTSNSVDNYVVSQKFIGKDFFGSVKSVDFEELKRDNIYVTDKYILTYKDINSVDGKHIGIIVVGSSLDKVDSIVQHSSILIYVAVVIIVLLLLGIRFVFDFSIISPLKHTIHELEDTASHIEHSSRSLNDGSSNLANMAVEQSASVEQITATIETILDSVSNNVDSMYRLDELGHDMKDNASIGYSHMMELKSSMDNIANSSTRVNSIVNTIDEISFQTNLLALNAAVEAARAGDHGLGFAVVSEEVRSLATRSAEEAKKIHEVIESAVTESKNGIIVANNTNESFQLIVEKIQTTMDLIQETTDVSKEQKNSIDQLKSAIYEVDKVTQQLSVNSEEIAGMSDTLNKETKSANTIVVGLSQMV
jgi:methyl-accepting chemotaxis protein